MPSFSASTPAASPSGPRFTRSRKSERRVSCASAESAAIACGASMRILRQFEDYQNNVRKPLRQRLFEYRRNVRSLSGSKFPYARALHTLGRRRRMKITNVRAHVLEAQLSQPFAYARAWYSTRTAMLVEIETDQGLTGWGECYGPA